MAVADRAEESKGQPPPVPPTGVPISVAGAIAGQPPGLTARRARLYSGVGCALDEGENQASDGRREGRAPRRKSSTGVQSPRLCEHSAPWSPRAGPVYDRLVGKPPNTCRVHLFAASAVGTR